MTYRIDLREHCKILIRVLQMFDAMCVPFSLWTLNELYGLPWSPLLSELAGISCVLSFVVFHSVRLYRPWRGLHLYREFAPIVKTWVVCIGIILLVLFATKTSYRFSRRLVITWFLATPFLIFFVHMMARLVLGKMRERGFNLRSGVVVGANSIGRQFTRYLQDLPWAGIRIEGFFDDRLPKDTPVETGLPVLGSVLELPEFLKRHSIDYVYIALPLKAQEKILRILGEARASGAKLLLVPDIFSFQILSAELVSLGDIPLVSFNPDFKWKRHFDMVFSLCILFLALPFFLVIGLLVKIQDGGPIFYSHRRVTAGGKEFRCWKFRTMVPDAEKRLQKILDSDPEASGEWQKGFKLKDDQRITKIGRFLRKASLDELPQFFNVLKGDMSIVGARPVVSKELYDYYHEEAGLYCSIKPGITGLWQVGKRNDIVDYGERVKADIWYIQHLSPWMDLKIIAKTAWRVIRPNGAY